MAEGDGSEAHTIFDVFVIVHVPYVASFATHNVRGTTFRELVISFGIRVSPTWDIIQKPRAQFLRLDKGP
jgi:hypothetical protein